MTTPTQAIVGRSIDGHPVAITIRDSLVVALERVDAAPGDVWISPGWIDIQVNGYAGYDPNATRVSDDVVPGLVRALWATGVTASCITICTESEERMVSAMRAIALARSADPVVAAAILGVHVEGPHIAREDGPRGAHPAAHIRPPDTFEYSRWQEAADGQVVIVTLSPEYPEAPTYIEHIVNEGVVASIGHTAANQEQICAAVDAGARLSTHLGNGAHATLPRHPNYIWDQLAEDRLSAGFVFDGHHLPPEVMQTVVRAKGVHRSILVSDAVALAGLPPGDYEGPSGVPVTLLPSGRLELKNTPFLAGAARDLATGVSNAIAHAGATLEEAVAMVTANPARVLGLAGSAGHESLQLGMRANLTIFRHPMGSSEIEIVGTIVDGHIVHGERETDVLRDGAAGHA